MDVLKSVLLNIIEDAGGTWGIVAEDLNHQLRLEYGEQVSFTAESIIKIPIMAAVFAEVEKQQLSLSDLVLLKREDLVGGSGVLQHLSPGIQLPVYDLLMLMIIQSDNTATNLLIDLVGTKQVQQTMADLEMLDSQFHRKLMVYPAEIVEKNRITAADVSLLLKKLATGSFLSHKACQQMINILKKQQIRNGLPAYLSAHNPAFIGEPPSWQLANKTGWDTGAQHDVGIFYIGQRTMTITVLSKDVDAIVALDAIARIGREIYHYAQQ
ncbi:serine hydrolase [Ammoniphilus sp. CFH 90114]|uniref:serine hydrolase n=1 Tax=Ammoniphilus sp. CFH 90114 TaxID=2493665 RepID=UPI00100DF9D9|nr:serine hydrolase [Ammoniphilus sp. CFH 90114]RXT02780.1 serine hydrolase [Ammoniphilus sp. CFH 90114]